jgi:N utilization substance protein A
VFLYPRLGRAIVLVKEDQLSLAIGRRGQNVRLASKLVGWDIEIMTHDELNDGIEKAERWFSRLPSVSPELVEAFIEEGFLSYDDLTFLDTKAMAEFTGLTEDEAEELIACAEEASERGEPAEEETASDEAVVAVAAEAPAEVEAQAEEASPGEEPARVEAALAADEPALAGAVGESPSETEEQQTAPGESGAPLG